MPPGYNDSCDYLLRPPARQPESSVSASIYKEVFGFEPAWPKDDTAAANEAANKQFEEALALCKAKRDAASASKADVIAEPAPKQQGSGSKVYEWVKEMVIYGADAIGYK